jgi:hypothetical protein
MCAKQYDAVITTVDDDGRISSGWRQQQWRRQLRHADAGGTQHVNEVENGDESHRVIAGSRRSRQNDCWPVTHVGRRREYSALGEDGRRRRRWRRRR